MEISYLNHASVIITEGEIKLLTDPWFWGNCFEDGWGLQYSNPEAIEKSKECTHLWVSHFHQDHFHRPTLLKILELNPAICFIGNHSYNFQLDKAAEQLGFRNIITFYERKPLRLSEKLVITRYPTTGIDNMLLIRTGKETILNYNDCSIPARSQKMLKRKMGPINYLLTNFNHAGKLLLYPYPSPAVIREKLIKSFSENYSVFNPDHVLPFASYHFYRAPDSFRQNEAMLDGSDLAPLDEKILNWHIGDKLMTGGRHPVIIKETPVIRNKPDQMKYQVSYPDSELIQSSVAFSSLLKKRFGFFTRFFPDLIIEVSDTGGLFCFRPTRGLITPGKKRIPHIRAHSESLFNWFSKPYGTDSFVVGAHFDIVNENRMPLKWQIVIGLLADNKLDLFSIIKMLFRREGIRFLWNRREEIWGILTSFRIGASYHKD